MSNEVLKDWLNKEDKPDLFTIILTSVGTEIIAFRKSTKKITNKDDDFLTNAITKRIMRNLEDDKLIPSPSGSEAWVSAGFLAVLEENYEAAKRMVDEDKARPAQEIVLETYEDLISIYKAKYNNHGKI